MITITTKAELAVPHSTTLRVHRTRAKGRQVLERVRASAAFPLARLDELAKHRPASADPQLRRFLQINSWFEIRIKIKIRIESKIRSGAQECERQPSAASPPDYA